MCGRDLKNRISQFSKIPMYVWMQPKTFTHTLCKLQHLFVQTTFRGDVREDFIMDFEKACAEYKTLTSFSPSGLGQDRLCGLLIPVQEYSLYSWTWYQLTYLYCIVSKKPDPFQISMHTYGSPLVRSQRDNCPENYRHS